MLIRTEDFEKLLIEHDLLVEKQANKHVSFDALHYDSRKVVDNTLFVVKGAFKKEYLTSALKNGASGFITEEKLDTDADQWIVSNSQKALALLSALYFNYPQEQLTIIGITGTKGKTTTAYLLWDILNKQFQNQVALFSTIDRITGPSKKDCKKSDLTTPESYELFADMRKAVDNGMRYLVMEVSSQAYLKNRVYNLNYDYGIFLNISPDHIGPNEHPDFADYLKHKLMLFEHVNKIIVNADSDCYEEIKAKATSVLNDKNIISFSENNKTANLNYLLTPKNIMATGSKFSLLNENTQKSADFYLDIAGDYNIYNAAAAAIVALDLAVDEKLINEALSTMKIPGRMVSFDLKDHGIAFVDYAHNRNSTYALFKFAKEQSPQGKVIVVLGSTGNKAESRRKDFGEVISELVDEVYLTTDDPQYEDPKAIAKEIASHITNPEVKIHFVMDRNQAIHEAIQEAKAKDIVVVAGKGEDKYQKINGENVAYPGDYAIVKEISERL